MVYLFLICSALLALGLFLNKNRVVNYVLVAVYGILMITFGVYEFVNQGISHSLFFKSDSLGVLLLSALCIISIPVLFHSYRYIELNKNSETPQSRGMYFGALAILMSASGAAYLSNHIAVTWILIEITTLSASLLIYHHRSVKALEGTWKYVFICAISITLVYVGILFLSLAMKQAGIDDMSYDSLIKNYSLLNPFWLKLAFLFIFTGFTAKLGLVPMYTAGIDAKDKAPGPVSAILASALMNVGFVSVYRTYAIIAHTPYRGWANSVIIIAAILTVFVAAVYMTRVKNIKRLFAYSGIEHMGIVMLGLAAGGIGIYASILHILLHTLIKPALFLQYNQIYRVYGSKSIYDLGNYFKYNKTGALLILLAFFSVTAMPPSGLFVSEFMIFQSLFESHHLFLLIILLVLLTVIIWGFATNVFRLLYIPPVSFDETNVPKISPWESVLQYILIIISVYFAYNSPGRFIDMIEQAVRIIN
ncbi:MAG: proton-conducting transporter membrane subunit [Bacteroidales bacterium]|nr:proton-conducting transporter membrane subunit [Bacteroidales bacterium]